MGFFIFLHVEKDDGVGVFSATPLFFMRKRMNNMHF